MTVEQKLRRSLLELSLKNGDYRDDLITIACYYYNLKHLGINADGVLEEVAHLSGTEFRDLIMGFISRKPTDKSLDTWSLRIEQKPQGPMALFDPNVIPTRPCGPPLKNSGC